MITAAMTNHCLFIIWKLKPWTSLDWLMFNRTCNGKFIRLWRGIFAYYA